MNPRYYEATGTLDKEDPIFEYVQEESSGWEKYFGKNQKNDSSLININYVAMPI